MDHVYHYMKTFFFFGNDTLCDDDLRIDVLCDGDFGIDNDNFDFDFDDIMIGSSVVVDGPPK